MAEARAGGGFVEREFASDWRGGVEHQVTDRSGRPNFDRPDSRGSFGDKSFDRSMMAPVVAESRPDTGAWRSTAAPVRSEQRSGGPMRSAGQATESFRAPAAAAEIKKPVLNLLPRTKPVGSVPDAAQVYTAQGSSNPFGAARPVDTAKKIGDA